MRNASHIKLAAAAAAILVLTVVIAFAGVRQNAFVNYDDPCYVVGNEHVRSGLTAANLSWAFTATECGNWHPLTWLALMLDVEWFGLDPAGHHGMAVAWHAVASAILLLVLWRATGAIAPSALVAFLFAVHPLHVQSVAWTSERKDLVSACFGFLSMGAYVAWARNRTAWRAVAVVATYALGLLAKPMLVTWPFVFLLLDLWPLGRMQPGPGLQRTLARLVLEKTPLFVMAAASCVVTIMVQSAGGAVGSLAELPLRARAANAAVAYWVYVGQMFWPARLSFLYPFDTSIPTAWIIVAVLALLGASIAALRLVRAAPFVAVGWLWYLGTLVPVIGLVQVGAQARADRYTYIPLIGLFIVIAWGGRALAHRFQVPAAAVAALGVLAVGACVVLTRHEVGWWRDTEALVRRGIAVTEDNGFAHYYLAKELAARNQDAEAVSHYAEAARLLPAHVDLFLNYGNALTRLGRASEALPVFEHALSLAPTDPGILFASSSALAQAGQRDAAIARLEAALALRPDHAGTHYNLGVLLGDRGDRVGAARHLREALRIDPGHAKARAALDRVGD